MSVFWLTGRLILHEKVYKGLAQRFHSSPNIQAAQELDEAKQTSEKLLQTVLALKRNLQSSGRKYSNVCMYFRDDIVITIETKNATPNAIILYLFAQELSKAHKKEKQQARAVKHQKERVQQLKKLLAERDVRALCRNTFPNVPFALISGYEICF